MMKKLEVACFTKESAWIAYNSGADRIEFCQDYLSGGISPKIEDFNEIKSKIPIPIFVMIRNRPGNFVYSKEEINTMREEIRQFQNSGAEGFVFGCLLPNYNIDVKACEALFEVCASLPCTFHRAFDETKNKKESLKCITGMGFSNLLTSGGKSNATDGIDTILRLIEPNHSSETFDLTKNKNKINIIVGGGIRSNTIERFKAIKDLEWFHTAAITEKKNVVDGDEIEKIKKILIDFDIT